MIGLGSNRLSVCRRGGMSVTQAGRGGMEWLAGGRLPSWANPYLPYSKAAGEALVAQFPTQWPTIRDYGFAHPALVPFINEDPMMVCSLGLPGMPWRWIKGDSVSYFDLGFKPYDDMCVRTFALRRGGGCIIGSRIGNANNIFVIADDAQSFNRVRFDAWNYNSFSYNNNVYTKWRILTNDLIHGKCMFDNTVVATFNRSHYTNALNLFVLACNNNGTAQHWEDKHPQFAYIDFENTSGGLDHRIAPYKGNKLIDIIEARVIENAGGGTLEYGYVLPDGTPWTPAS